MNIYAQVGQLFLVILIGFYASKRNFLNEEINNGLSSILLNITLPLLIVNSFNLEYNSEMFTNIVNTFLYSVASFIIVILISHLLYFKVKYNNKQILKFATIFSNCGFMGFAIIQTLYGKEGLAYASIFLIVFTTLIWSYGIMLFSGEKKIKSWTKILINPGIIAVLIGLVFMAFSIQLPLVLQSAIQMVGGMTTPISMIITGSIMAQVSITKEMTNIKLYYGVFSKLILVPVVLYLISVILHINSLPLDVVIVCHAMPVAAVAPIFAGLYDKNKDFAAFLVFISTLFSIITIPLILKIIS